jgi:hypothetical protein
MKLSDRIRDEISKAGLVRWDDLEEEVDKLEKDIVRLERMKSIIDEVQVRDSVYVGGMNNILEMCKASSLDMETTRYVLQLYNDNHGKLIDYG